MARKFAGKDYAVTKLEGLWWDPADVRDVQLVPLTEGECVQILHVGPYTEETERICKMRAFAAQDGRKFAGKHHEIYLSDSRRVRPEKLKTILRNPVA